MKHYAYTALISTALCASCAPVPVTEAKPQGSAKRKATPVIQREADQPSPVTLKLVTLEDPVEKAYTIGMPEGWANRTYSARVFDVHSMVDIAISPNGSVLIFAGDPSIPQYWSPHAATEMTRQFAKFNPKMRIEAFRPADTFFPAYVRRKYGKLPGFKITSTGADRELQQALQARFDEAGGQSQRHGRSSRFLLYGRRQAHARTDPGTVRG